MPRRIGTDIAKERDLAAREAILTVCEADLRDQEMHWGRIDDAREEQRKRWEALNTWQQELTVREQHLEQREQRSERSRLVSRMTEYLKR